MIRRERPIMGKENQHDVTWCVLGPNEPLFFSRTGRISICQRKRRSSTQVGCGASGTQGLVKGFCSQLGIGIGKELLACIGLQRAIWNSR